MTCDSAPAATAPGAPATLQRPWAWPPQAGTAPAPTCLGGHPSQALLFLPEADVILECQEIKKQLEGIEGTICTTGLAPRPMSQGRPARWSLLSSSLTPGSPAAPHHNSRGMLRQGRLEPGSTSWYPQRCPSPHLRPFLKTLGRGGPTDFRLGPATCPKCKHGSSQTRSGSRGPAPQCPKVGDLHPEVGGSASEGGLLRGTGVHVDSSRPQQARGHSLPPAPTELLQGVHGILHVDPEAQAAQRDFVVAHGERQLRGGAVDDLQQSCPEDLPPWAAPTAGALCTCRAPASRPTPLHPT